MNRRTFLSRIAAIPLIGAASISAATKRPNVVIIMADDMGFSDVGCYGGEIRTPNIDSLAKGGVRFTQFYNAARCCPTRAALLTGLYNHQAGVGNMVTDMGHPSYQGYLNTKCVTIAEALRPAGYRTYMAGKWHVGEERPHWPVDRGFDRYFGLISGAANYFRPEDARTVALDGERWKPGPNEKYYATDAFTDWSVRYIEDHSKTHAEKPFFLYLPYTSPHWPLHAWPEDISKYLGKYRENGWDKLREERHKRQIEMGLIDAKWGLSPRGDGIPAWDSLTPREKDDFDLRMAVYAAQIDRMDQGIGRVLDALRKTGQFDNTVILFLADNGGCHEEKIRGETPVPAGPVESFTSYGRPWANASNTPFRMYKHWVHEGGISSPLILHWPAELKRGGGFDRDPAHVTDLMATALDAAGAPYPKSHKGTAVTPTDGRSLLPVARGKKREVRDAIFWEHEGARAVRMKNWKLVAAHNGPWELYDIASDRCERNNLIDSQKDRAALMQNKYDEWATRCEVVPFAELQKRRA
ncbi:MAG: arylsulfatase [Bryobacteraceae bacterium]|nr:arylsulfatase [Bryobacteraceae bacterium]